VQMNRRVEGVRPFHHRGVEMRVRNRDRFYAAETLDQRDRCFVQKRDAIPQHVAAGRAHQQRALADGEPRLRPDAEDVRLVGAKAVDMALPERRERRPALPARRDVLPLLLADRALRGRIIARRVLRAAGSADKGGHDSMMLHLFDERNNGTAKLTFGNANKCL
jgi:hypothetical protein